MNAGIIDMNQFQKIENELKNDYVELVETTKSLKGEFEQVFNGVSNSDISFLGTSYLNEINELEKVNNKINNYYSILSNVRVGYQNQAYEISQGVNLYLNKLNEEVNN